MKSSLRSNRRSRPEKEGAESWEVERKGREELQQEEGKEGEESDMAGTGEGKVGVEEFTLGVFSDFSHSITAEIRIKKKPMYF